MLLIWFSGGVFMSTVGSSCAMTGAATLPHYERGVS
jgi:hypothetical protein